jgi:hypothetical protein
MASAKTSSLDDITSLPEPSHITLLLRHHKSVTLISVSPNQSFDSIKQLLLSALQARGIPSLHNTSDPTAPTPLPSSPDYLDLGILIDKKDPSKGWKPITPGVNATSSGKKKASNKSTDTNTPDGLGLVDGSWLAYRVSADKSGSSSKVDEDNDENNGMDVTLPDDPGWDVVIPSFEEEEEEEVEEETAEAGPS